MESVQCRAILARKSYRLPYRDYKIVHGIKKVNWGDKNKILKPNQNITGRRHDFQLSRELKIMEGTNLYQI